MLDIKTSGFLLVHCAREWGPYMLILHVVGDEGCLIFTYVYCPTVEYGRKLIFFRDQLVLYFFPTLFTN